MSTNDPFFQERQPSYTQASARPERTPGQTERFLIAGVGVSSHRLKALARFFQHLPADIEMAFVVSPLPAADPPDLVDLLQRCTEMAVQPVITQTPIRINHIYILPLNRFVAVREGILHLEEPSRRYGHPTALDYFLNTLAEDQGDCAAGVLLAGVGSDGRHGLRAIKEQGGLALAQSLDEAGFDAGVKDTSTHLVDILGPAEELATYVATYQEQRRQIQLASHAQALSEGRLELLNKILFHVQDRTGHDFTVYKRSALLRRLGRRMHLRQAPSLAAYLEYLRQHSEEADVLFQDFLIPVTDFFRDDNVFATLAQQVVPKLFVGKRRDDQVRVWVPGCASGEEAYSVAILLLEHAAHLVDPPEIQVFATDVNEDALAMARQGWYPETIAANVSAQRLQRFFTAESGGYRVVTDVREKILFSVHNLLKDPPFARLDLISCRNLLIYLKRDVQKQVLTLLHYALRSEGFLVLGNAESVEPASGFFLGVEKKGCIFQRQNVISAPRIPTRSLASAPVRELPVRSQATQQPATKVEDLYRVWQQKRYAPPSLLVDEDHGIYEVFNGAGVYLQEQDGRATLDILHKVLPALRIDLRMALYQAFEHRKRTKSRLLQVTVDGEERVIQLQVGPVEEPGFPQKYVEVIFLEVETAPLAPIGVAVAQTDGTDPLLARLEEELLHTREQLQATVEEYETAHEELMASNEELQSMNAELRSTTEELETSKEELQSINEELVAVNQELKAKIDELSQANSDLQNLIESTDVATIFLDRDLRVKRYTPRAIELFHLLPNDIGRPFAQISHQIAYERLIEDAEQVLQKLTPVEHEVQDKRGNWLIARLIPYRTLEDRIDGVVLTCVDVTALKEAEQALAQRALQQTTVAELGQLALEDAELDLLREEITRRVTETLDIELCKVLELLPDGETLLLKGGVGWQEGYVGHATVGTAKESQAGYTLHVNGPVIVKDLRTERRFYGPKLLFEHGVVSGLSVVIRGTKGAYGVLGAHTARERSFSADDVYFVQSVANVLAQAIERRRAQEALEQANQELETRVKARTHDLALANDQLQAEVAAHKRTQERFYKAFQATPAASVIASLTELRYLNVNTSFLAMTGYSEEEIIGRTAQEVGLLVDAEKREPAATSLRAGQAVKPNESRIRTKSGEIRHVIIAGEPIELDGQPCLLGMMFDVTERKEAEDALRKSQKLLAEAEAITGMGSWEWDLLTDTLYWSPGMSRIFQLDREAAPASDGSLLAHIHPEDRHVVQQTFRAAQVHQQPFDIEFRLLHTDGGVRTVVARGKVTADETDAPVKMIGTVQDITERKAVEEALRLNEQRLRTAIEASGVGIYEHNIPADGDSYYSDRFAAIFGYTLDELPPVVQRVAWLTERIHPEDRPHLEQVYQDLVEGRIARYEVEARVQHKNGKWICIRALSHVATRNAEGRVTRMVGVIQDITEQKERETALETYQEHLQELVAERTAELEFKTQELAQEVTVRKQAESQLLALNESLEERVAERTEQVRVLASALTLAEQRERQRIAGILHDHLQQVLYALLFRTKLFALGEPLQQESLLDQFRALVEDAIGTTRTLTIDLSPPILAGEGLVEALTWLADQMKEIHRFDVTLRVQERPSELRAEMRVLLFQLVRELLFNVVKHAGVTQAAVSIEQVNNQLIIAVEDTGRGFDVEAIYTDQENGGGWGLFSIRERLGLFGGRLNIASEPGQGTNVTIFFPFELGGEVG